MILLDSSAWIEFLRGTNSAVDQAVAELLAREERLAVVGPVLAEVLAGARDERHAGELTRLLARAELLRLQEPADFEAAAAIYRGCRAAGRPVGSLADCVIAAVAIRRGARVLHADADFETIASLAPLELAA